MKGQVSLLIETFTTVGRMNACKILYVLARHNVGTTYSNGLRCPSVCLSCHTRIFLKLSEIDLQLRGNSNRKPCH